jgi:hypothetical protein
LAAPHQFVTVFGIIFFITASLALGQTASIPPPGGERTPLPLSHLYWHFLIHQDHLDRAAVLRQKQGKDGSWLHDYYQRRLGFNDAEFRPVRQTALRLEAELNDIDAKVKSVVKAARAAHPRVLKSPRDLPPLPPELYELREQHEAAIAREVARLKAALGVERTAKLEAFLRNDFAPNVTHHVLNPPRPGDGTKRLAPAPPKEVRP